MNERTRRALVTKRKITEVALELFNERGFSNVTVDEIISKSGTSKGAFYNHFKSKHDIFLEKFKTLDDMYVNVLLPRITSTASSEEKLKLFIKLQMEYIEDTLGWDVTRTIYEQELNTERESFFLMPNRPLYQIIYSFCEEAQKNQEFRHDYTINEMVTIIVRAMRGILYDWSINKGSYSIMIEQEKLFEVIFNGLKWRNNNITER